MQTTKTQPKPVPYGDVFREVAAAIAREAQAKGDTELAQRVAWLAGLDRQEGR